MVNIKMPDINYVCIAGNLTRDPSCRKTLAGVPVANFTIANNRKFKDNLGGWREEVCFIVVVAWHKLAESCSESIKKGSAVLVEGELQSRNWRTPDGYNRNIVEIKARRIQFLDRREVIEHVEEEGPEEGKSAEEGEKTPTEESLKKKAPSEAVIAEAENQPNEKENFDFGYKDLEF